MSEQGFQQYLMTGDANDPHLTLLTEADPPKQVDLVSSHPEMQTMRLIRIQ